MRIFLGLLFLVLGIPTLIIAIGTLFGHQHFEAGGLFLGAPLSLLGFYCLLGPD
jgi:hypothetical protein